MNKRTRWIALVGLAFFIAKFSFANPLNAGNIAFEKGDFNEAYDLYQKAHQQGLNSFELYHNLGTTAAKLDRLGEARLFLEKALLVKPGNSETRKNIKWIKTELSDNIAPLPELLPQVYWNSISAWLNSSTWYYLSFFSLLLAAFVLFTKLFKQEARTKGKFLLALLILSLAISLIFALLGSSRSQQLSCKNHLVVMEEAKQLVSEPETGAEIIQELSIGAKVEVKSELGDWAKVIAEDGAKGWIINKGLSIIEL